MRTPADHTGAYSPMLCELGARLRARRLALGLSQQELADRAGLSRSTVGSFETARQDIPVTQLALLAYLLDMDVSALCYQLAVQLRCGWHSMAGSTSPLLSELGERLRARRIALGWTQAELARRACYSRASVANLEAGRQDMPVTQLALFAYLLGVDLTTLFHGLSITQGAGT